MKQQLFRSMRRITLKKTNKIIKRIKTKQKIPINIKNKKMLKLTKHRRTRFLRLIKIKMNKKESNKSIKIQMYKIIRKPIKFNLMKKYKIKTQILIFKRIVRWNQLYQDNNKILINRTLICKKFKINIMISQINLLSKSRLLLCILTNDRIKNSQTINTIIIKFNFRVLQRTCMLKFKKFRIKI